jgi:beta-lactamase superfamily II metal-dependent hydrolase
MNMTEMKVWDVEHGLAIYIKSPNDKNIVIDLGQGSWNNDSEFSPLEHLYYNYNIRTIDYLIITHPHLDHIDDILNINLFDVKVLSRPKHLTTNDINNSNTSQNGLSSEAKDKINKYLELNQNFIFPVTENINPFNPNNFGGLKIRTFLDDECATSNINNHSIITVLEYANSKIVICGDNESCSYNKLLEQDNFKNTIKDADILVASHHGRKSGYHKEFFELVNPRATIISDNQRGSTDFTDTYSRKSRGCKNVFKDDTQITKNTLTTRSNGRIKVSFGLENFLKIDIQKKGN